MLIQYVDNHGEILTLRAIETLDRLIVSGVVNANTLIREGVEEPWIEAALHPLAAARFPKPTTSIDVPVAQSPPPLQSAKSGIIAEQSPKVAAHHGDRPVMRDKSLSAVLRNPKERWADFVGSSTISHERRPQSPREVFDFLFSFTGRLSRQGYWQRLATVFVLYTLSSMIFGGEGLLAGVTALISAVAVFAAAVRRLHDMGQPGEWSLLLLIPLVNVAVIVAGGAIPGTSTSNAYGSSPLQPSSLAKREEGKFS